MLFSSGCTREVPGTQYKKRMLDDDGLRLLILFIIIVSDDRLG